MTSISKAIPSDSLPGTNRADARSHSSDLLSESSQDSLQNRRQQIKQRMEACRNSTLALFQTVDYETFCQQAHPDFSPIGWHLGHIAYTEALWLLEHAAGCAPQFPEYRRLFAADTLPKAERVYLPDFAEVQTYLQTVRKAVFASLETAPLDEQERLWRWLLQHESQHGETIALVLELVKRQAIESGQRSAVSGQPLGELTVPSSLIPPQGGSKLHVSSPTPHTPHPLPPCSAFPQAPLNAAIIPSRRSITNVQSTGSM